MLKTIQSCVILIFILLSFSLQAAPSLDTLFFRVAPDNTYFLQTEQSSPLEHLRYSLAANFDHSRRPVRVQIGATPVTLIDDIIVSQFGAALGLGNFFNLGVSLPFVFFAERSRFVGNSTIDSTQLGFGDIEVVTKFSIIEPLIPNPAIGLAVAPFARFPTGQTQNFFGAGGYSYGGVLIIDTPYLLFGYLRLAINAGYMRRPDLADFQSTGVPTPIKDQIIVKGAAQVFIDKHWSVGLEGVAQSNISPMFSHAATSPKEARLFVQWKPMNSSTQKDGLQLSAFGGMGIGKGLAAPQFREGLGLRFTGRIPYKPRVKEKRRVSIAIVELERALDLNPNAIYDLRGTCPDNPGDFDPKIHQSDCNKLYVIQKTVLNCPVPEYYQSDRDPQACPKFYDLQQSQDKEEKIAEYNLFDLCQNVEEGHKNWDINGCGSQYAVVYLDQKLVTQEYQIVNMPRDQLFALELAVADLKRLEVVKREYDMGVPLSQIPDFRPIRHLVKRKSLEVAPVLFSFRRTNLDGDDMNIIRQLAFELRVRPEIKKVLIAGHTDNIGSYEKNRQLSLDRANAVLAALIRRGIDPTRIVTKGFAYDQPRATNMNPKGRKQNRRVEVFVMESGRTL